MTVFRLFFPFALFCPALAPAADALATRGQASFDQKIKPLLEKYCFDCHSDGVDKGNFLLDEHTDYAAMRSDFVMCFNLPDYRGMFLRGFDAGRGVDPGRAFASFQDDEIEAHNHGLNDPGHVHAVRTAGDSGYGGGANPGVDLANPLSFRGENTQSSITGITISAFGGSETRPKNVSVYICIKT